MKKPWSITTTLRNPERLRNFLIVLKQLENCKWDLENQKKYQVLLIKDRIYGYNNKQFYKNLSKSQINLIDDHSKAISYEQAQDIFNTKCYNDPAMRGRQSINPLKKIGLITIKNKQICITSLGNLFLKDEFDLGEIFFRSFLKWQIPNLDNNDYKLKDGYDIKPFLGVLHLIWKVNEMSKESGEKAKGISKDEFALFCPTLVNYKEINSYAEKIIELRKKLKNKTKQDQKDIWDKYRNDFAKAFLGTQNKTEIQKLLGNVKDYGDNAIRYFRLTRYIYIRGNGFYIDLEPIRMIEIEKLLKFDNAQSKSFKEKDDYLNYISDISKPKLPWENLTNLLQIADYLLKDIKNCEKNLKKKTREFSDFKKMNESDLKTFISELRNYRRELQDIQVHNKSQEIDQINKFIDELKNIFKSNDKPIMLEKLMSLGLNALNDAKKIKPNYPVGDDNEPTFTAPANIPDIECFYETYNAICEATMLTGRNQWYNEGQPVMRHLRDFETKHKKDSYCLFVAPNLHRDTINTFWNAIKYDYEGQKQKIIPLSINNFIELLQILVEMKQKQRFLSHTDLLRLYDEILNATKSSSNSIKWTNNIPNIIISWKESLKL